MEMRSKVVGTRKNRFGKMEDIVEKFAIGCRIHAENEDCRGEVKNRVSVHGAEMEMCDAAFLLQPAGLWS